MKAARTEPLHHPRGPDHGVGGGRDDPDPTGSASGRIGTLREMVAQNIVAATCNALNRVGLNEYEWPRLRKPF